MDEIIEIKDPGSDYSPQLLYKRESYNIIGACFEVHAALGRGFAEIVYKDALAHEFSLREIPFQRERKFGIMYKSIELPRNYVCDFIVYDKIVVEIKSQSTLVRENSTQLLNYLAVSHCKLGLLVNFGENSLKFRRLVL